MTVTAITLVDPVSGLTVPIMPADGVAAQVLDVAAPARAVEEDRAGAHGSYDVTRYLSAAAVSLSLLLFPGVTQTPEKFLDALGPLLTPALRPYLIVANDQWDQPRQLTVRFDSSAKPLSDPTNWPVQVSWKAPNGVWEGSNLANAVIGAFIPSAGTGFIVGATGAVVTTAGVVITATTAPAPSLVTSPGNVPSQWTAVLRGPCTGPKLANDTAGMTLEFSPNLNLGAGDYVAIDSLAQTATLNGQTPVLGFLSFATSHWWLIQPGLNALRYYPVSAGPGSAAQISFRPAWLA